MSSNELYKEVFDTVLDSDILRNSTVLMIGKDLTESDRLEILEHISLRLQVEFGKTVRFISSYGDKSDIIIQKGYDSSYLPTEFNPQETAFIANVYVGNFNRLNSWEVDMLSQLAYYKFPVYGFSSYQSIKVYEP